MTEYLQTAYVFLWAALAVLMFLIGRKLGRVGYLMSVFFVFMSVWYGLRAFGGLPVFDGWYSNIFRGVLIAFLVFIAVLWYRDRKARKASENTETNTENDITEDTQTD